MDDSDLQFQLREGFPIERHPFKWEISNARTDNVAIRMGSTLVHAARASNYLSIRSVRNRFYDCEGYQGKQLRLDNTNIVLLGFRGHHRHSTRFCQD